MYLYSQCSRSRCARLKTAPILSGCHFCECFLNERPNIVRFCKISTIAYVRPGLVRPRQRGADQTSDFWVSAFTMLSSGTTTMMTTHVKRHLKCARHVRALRSVQHLLRIMACCACRLLCICWMYVQIPGLKYLT